MAMFKRMYGSAMPQPQAPSTPQNAADAGPPPRATRRKARQTICR
jgi:hypothetical protein